MQDRLSLSNSNLRDLPARQQTLRGAIEWSYNLLSPGERHLFNHLAVFVGGCTAEAVSTVIESVAEVEPTLQSLVDQSLLKYEQSEHGAPRYVMLEMLREYAWERLTEASELSQTGAG